MTRMRLVSLTRLLVLSTVLLWQGAARAQSLEARLNTLLAQPSVKNANVGISIVQVGDNGPVELFGHNATTPMTPASCTKLLTTAAAFSKYGVTGAFETKLFKIGPNLLILGSGDPCFADAKLLGPDGHVTDVFDQWAAKLKAVGITEYADLLVDDRVFDQEFVHPDWPADQLLSWYEAPIGGLNFNANCLDWLAKRTASGIQLELIPTTTYVTATVRAKAGTANRISLVRPADANTFELRGTLAATLSKPESVTILDPGLWTGTILKDRLATAGIRGTGQVRRRADADSVQNAQVLCVTQTPVSKVIARANKNSLNMAAEGLCKRLGHDAAGQAGSWDNGTAAVAAFATGQGVAPEQVALHDGSGLSAFDRVSPRAFTTVLARVAAGKDGGQFVASLAIPGEDGTLEHKRFVGKAMAKVAAAVHAKTGHIKGVSCLTGYLDIDGKRYAFSILCHKYIGNVNPWQDDVCKAIFNWASEK
ncbi:MAG: D-alanyl-D-alanine carboxypeptidase/D-alanyl-D-alanine-endopeptidase [Phycisphaerae bacterium]